MHSFLSLSTSQAKAMRTRKRKGTWRCSFGNDGLAGKMHTQFSRYQRAGRSGEKCFAFRDKNFNQYFHETRRLQIDWSEVLLKKKKPGLSSQGIEEEELLGWVTHGLQPFHIFAMCPQRPEDSRVKAHLGHSRAVQRAFPVRPACAEQPHATQ